MRKARNEHTQSGFARHPTSQRPVLHRVTAGIHCNLAVNPGTIEAQVQGAAVTGLSMCLPGSAITLKDGVVEQSNFDG
jgi:isoquinoline 1-oxidoreductase beta subunit